MPDDFWSVVVPVTLAVGIPTAAVIYFMVRVWFLPTWRGAQVTKSKPGWYVFQLIVVLGVGAWLANAVPSEHHDVGDTTGRWLLGMAAAFVATWIVSRGIDVVRLLRRP
jgi:hypothetical protein